MFFDVLTVAGCHLATSPWPQNLVLGFADGNRARRGFDGFALVDLPWTDHRAEEKAFFLELLALAADRYGWDRLTYDPPYAHHYVTRLRDMLTGFTPTPVAAPAEDWRIPPAPELLVRCPRHDLYTGYLGCRLCDTWIQGQPQA